MAPKPPRQEIECRSLRGPARRFPAEAIRFRPAAYGVALRNGRVLLGRSVFTGLLEIPGGAVEPWETLTEGLRREFREETGVEPEPGRLLCVRESFIHFFDRPFHSLRFYYLVDVPDDAVWKPDEREVRDLGWVPVAELDPSDLGDDDAAAIRMALEGSVWGGEGASRQRAAGEGAPRGGRPGVTRGDGETFDRRQGVT